MIRIAAAVSVLALAACQQAEAPADAAPSAPAPAPAADAANSPPAGLEGMLRSLLPTAGEVRYAWAGVDLNGDGAEEVLAYPVGQMICGSGGCPLYIFKNEGDYWRPVTVTSVTQTPIGVLETSTNGWRDLAVSVGGGGAPAGWVKLAFDGRTYPTNPTVAPAEPLDQPDATTLIASEPAFLPLP